MGLNHVLCTVSRVSLHWLLLAQLVGSPCLDQAEKLLLFPFWDCRHQFLTFFHSLQRCLSGCQRKHCHICSLFCLSHLCVFSVWCFGFLSRLCLPPSPLELGKHFCCSSHSSQWFFTFIIIIEVCSLSQILELSISHFLSSTFVRMQNQWQV